MIEHKKHIDWKRIYLPIGWLIIISGAFFFGYSYGWSTFPERHPEYIKACDYWHLCDNNTGNGTHYNNILPFGYDENMKWLEFDKQLYETIISTMNTTELRQYGYINTSNNTSNENLFIPIHNGSEEK